ncbi:hypothetical protein [Planococcus sp. YIM B11945]
MFRIKQWKGLLLDGTMILKYSTCRLLLSSIVIAGASTPLFN